MVPGGTTEIIWHFTGHFHIAIEDVRARLEYEEGPFRLRQEDYVAKLPHYDFDTGLEPLNTARLLPPELTPDAAAFIGTIVPLKLAGKIAGIKVTPPSQDEVGQLVKRPPGGGAAVGEQTISVLYSPGGDQRQVDIDQINMASDDDLFGVAPGTEATALSPSEIATTLQEMAEAANALIPSEINLPHTGVAAIAEFVATQNAVTAAGDAGSGSPAVKPGLYINGELQEEGAVRPEVPEVEVPPVDLDATGQWAKLGSNIATNAALIVDLNEAAPMLMVLGDYFKMNAIIQTNSFVDNDEVNSSSYLPGALITGDNQADNIAEFIQNTGVHGIATSNFGGPVWNVQIVEGDFFDIKLLVQQNFLQDNDVTLQDANEAHYQIVTGANGQYNLTLIQDLFQQYDMIVIGGDYHGGNFIFQNNILLDSDALKVVWGGDDAPTQTISSGQNALLNDASIINYGNSEFLPMGSGLDDLAAALASRQSSLDMSYGSLIPGNSSGVLNILYITGDYYDINALWQLNVIADLDTAMQLLGPSADGDELTQSAATGSNALTNQAVIVDVGSTVAFLAGDAYEDAILIQANIVTDDNDTVTVKDTDTLVSEVIAFTNAAEDDPNTDLPPSMATNAQDDVMGSVLT